jgi:hypothetical protein
MPDLTATDVLKTTLDLMLKGARTEQSNDLEVFATRLSMAVSAAAEQLLAEQQAEKQVDVGEVDSNASDEVAEGTQTADIEQEARLDNLCVATVNTFGNEIAERAEYLAKLDQNELNTLVAGLAALRAQQDNPEVSTLSQQMDEQWRALREKLEGNVASQEAAIALVEQDRAVVIAGTTGISPLDLSTQQRALTAQMDASYPSSIAEMIVQLGGIEEDIRAKRAERSDWDGYQALLELKEVQNQLLFDTNLVMKVIEHDVARSTEACRDALKSELERLAPGSTTTLRYEAALERLEGEIDCESTSAARISPWNRAVHQSRHEAEYLASLEFHAQTRLETVCKVLELVCDLRDANTLQPNDRVSFLAGGAAFQLDEGSVIDRTAGAHKLPGQLTIGVDPAVLDERVRETQERFRLDNLITDDQLLKDAVRGWFGTTTVTPTYVNAADKLWEDKGLREAFRGAVELIVRQPDNFERDAAIAQAYERFRDDAFAALNLARDHNEARLRELERRNSPPESPRVITQEDREAIRQVLEAYERTLEQARLDELLKNVAWRRD